MSEEMKTAEQPKPKRKYKKRVYTNPVRKARRPSAKPDAGIRMVCEGHWRLRIGNRHSSRHPTKEAAMEKRKQLIEEMGIGTLPEANVCR